MRVLRERLKTARGERKRRVARARTICKGARRGMKARSVEIRNRHRTAARDEILALRHQAKNACSTAALKAYARAAESMQRAGAALDAEQRYQKQLAIATRAPRLTAKHVQRAALERSRESDDEVANNLPEELRPVWRARAPKTKATERATRTEVFLDWAHNHSADVARIISDDLDRQIRELEKQEREHYRSRGRSAGAEAPF
jgi:hypothetical protein